MIKSDEWILGAVGFLKTSVLAETLYAKVKKGAELELREKFDVYQPWMQLKDSLFDLRSVFQKTPVIVEDRPSVLASLAKAISKPNDPLGALCLDVVVPGQEINQGNSELEMKAWRDRASQGVELFIRTAPLFERRFAVFIKTLVPLRVGSEPVDSKADASIGSSRTAISSHATIGAVYRAIPQPSEDPYWRLTFAIDLAHEIAHQAVAVYQRSDRLIASSFEQLVHSPIRKESRPAILSFHAVAALAYMIEYVEALQERSELLAGEEHEFLSGELNNYYTSLKEGLDALETVQFTDLGALLMKEYRALSETSSSKRSI